MVPKARRNSFRFHIALLAAFSTAGCTSNPADDTESTGPTATAPDSSVVATGKAEPMAEAPDGNTEPPLFDVSQAVDGVPAADATSVNVQVVSPEQFQAVIEKHRGKVVLVDFWATWCIPCRERFPSTLNFIRQHEGAELVTMAFDDEDSRDRVMKFLTEQNATGDNLICRFGGTEDSFAAYEINAENAGIPYYRVYDRTGKLRQVFANDVGAGKAIDEKDIFAAVEALLAE